MDVVVIEFDMCTSTRMVRLICTKLRRIRCIRTIIRKNKLC